MNGTKPVPFLKGESDSFHPVNRQGAPNEASVLSAWFGHVPLAADPQR